MRLENTRARNHRKRKGLDGVQKARSFNKGKAVHGLGLKGRWNSHKSGGVPQKEGGIQTIGEGNRFVTMESERLKQLARGEMVGNVREFRKDGEKEMNTRKRIMEARFILLKALANLRES